MPFCDNCGEVHSRKQPCALLRSLTGQRDNKPPQPYDIWLVIAVSESGEITEHLTRDPRSIRACKKRHVGPGIIGGSSGWAYTDEQNALEGLRGTENYFWARSRAESAAAALRNSPQPMDTSLNNIRATLRFAEFTLEDLTASEKYHLEGIARRFEASVIRLINQRRKRLDKAKGGAIS